MDVHINLQTFWTGIFLFAKWRHQSAILKKYCLSCPSKNGYSLLATETFFIRNSSLKCKDGNCCCFCVSNLSDYFRYASTKLGMSQHFDFFMILFAIINNLVSMKYVCTFSCSVPATNIRGTL